MEGMGSSLVQTPVTALLSAPWEWVACSTNSFMGYGPVTPHGYGASYNPHPNEIIFCISAFFSSDKTSASRFARSLQDSLDAMRDLLS
ncbi:hypothetical protein AND_001315 [Anopheles darlingi]|uniref:Choline O-acetyltransferase n=1 Tax=Anopheles darlingi TaxID=43151 RepID=W5JS12_ANODA|nr:hypothetical protein AND_001315 [Anopheles darlingi]